MKKRWYIFIIYIQKLTFRWDYLTSHYRKPSCRQLKMPEKYHPLLLVLEQEWSCSANADPETWWRSSHCQRGGRGGRELLGCLRCPAGEMTMTMISVVVCKYSSKGFCWCWWSGWRCLFFYDEMICCLQCPAGEMTMITVMVTMKIFGNILGWDTVDSVDV